MGTIVVLVKNVPDTWSAKQLLPTMTLDRETVDNVLDEINEFAVEQALRLRDDNPDAGLRVVALTMGPEKAEEAVRKAIAMGADDGVHLVDEQLEGSDVLATAWALTSAINTLDDVQLIVAGNASSDGHAGVIPGLIAEYRGIPALTNLHDVSVQGQMVQATRQDAHGVYQLESPLPAVLSVTEQSGKPRFPNFKGLMAAKKHQITKLDLAQIGVQPAQVGGAHAATAVLSAQSRPARAGGEILRGETAIHRVVELIAGENLL